MLNKTLAGFFAFFLGMFGVHYFYIGKWWKGVLQMGAFWTFVFLADVARGPGEDLFGMLIAITVLSAVITGITWWAMPEAKWRKKYDPESLAGEQGFGAMGLPAPSKNTKALKAEGIRYYRSADYDLAIEAFLEAADADIADPGTHFNLACSYAQLGQYPESMRHLELSVTLACQNLNGSRSTRPWRPCVSTRPSRVSGKTITAGSIFWRLAQKQQKHRPLFLKKKRSKTSLLLPPLLVMLHHARLFPLTRHRLSPTCWSKSPACGNCTMPVCSPNWNIKSKKSGCWANGVLAHTACKETYGS